MPAATADRPTRFRPGDRFDHPVAADTRIFTGVMVAITTAGVAVPAAAVATHKVVGVSDVHADNRGGAAGAQMVSGRRGCWQFGNSGGGDAITLADVNSPCYVVDDNTVAKTSNSNARPVAGVIRGVDAQGVWVEF